MSKRIIILLSALILISTPSWAQKPLPGVTSTGPALQPSVNLHSIRALNAQGVTALATQVHLNARTQVQQKLPLNQAVMQQKDLLATHPDVKEVVQLPGDNLFVRFKDNNELVMLMGEGRLGSGGTAPAQIQLAQSAVKQSPGVQSASPKTSAVTLAPPRAFPLPSIPGFHGALIFNALADDGNAANPTGEGYEAANSLASLGYYSTILDNDNANLTNLAGHVGTLPHGVIFICSHGCVLNGNDFMFLVRPWYDNYPPENTQYVGTVRSSAFSMKSNRVRFAYAVTGTFAKTYWKNKFPATQFFLVSCQSTHPAGLPGMATYVLNQGASAWVGWNDSVVISCAYGQTKEYFSQMAQGKTIAEAITYVSSHSARGTYDCQMVVLGKVVSSYCACSPPNLTQFATQSKSRLGTWYRNSVVRQEVPPTDRLSVMQVHSDGGTFYVRLLFGAATGTDNEFQIYANAIGGNGAKVLVKCHLNDFEVYKESAPGVYDNFLLRGVPYRALFFQYQYLVGIPWNDTFGNAIGAYLRVVSAVDSPKHDYLPASGTISLHK
jgi:hypothetical protein